MKSAERRIARELLNILHTFPGRRATLRQVAARAELPLSSTTAALEVLLLGAYVAKSFTADGLESVWTVVWPPASTTGAAG